MQSSGVPQPMWQQALGWGVTALVLIYEISCWYVFTRPHIIDAYDAAESAAV